MLVFSLPINFEPPDMKPFAPCEAPKVSMNARALAVPVLMLLDHFSMMHSSCWHIQLFATK